MWPQLKPQTTTKEEVAARRKKHILWVIPAGTVKEAKPTAAPATPATGSRRRPPPTSPREARPTLAAVPEKK